MGTIDSVAHGDLERLLGFHQTTSDGFEGAIGDVIRVRVERECPTADRWCYTVSAGSFRSGTGLPDQRSATASAVACVATLLDEARLAIVRAVQ